MRLFVLQFEGEGYPSEDICLTTNEDVFRKKIFPFIRVRYDTADYYDNRWHGVWRLVLTPCEINSPDYYLSEYSIQGFVCIYDWDEKKQEFIIVQQTNEEHQDYLINILRNCS